MERDKNVTQIPATTILCSWNEFMVSAAVGAD